MISSHIFYRDGRVTTTITDTKHRSIIEYRQAPLAEIRPGAKDLIHLIATDLTRSVVIVKDTTIDERHAYSPYGNACTLPSPNTLLGYHGERIDPHDVYLPGSYRVYSPGFMRFLSPDTWSPFGRAGINTYVYCKGDPINHTDPSGHMPLFLKNKKSITRSMAPRTDSARTPLGSFNRPGMRDVMETLNTYLPPDDMSALARTSKDMHQLVNEASHTLARRALTDSNMLEFIGDVSNNRLAAELPGVSRSAFNSRISELRSEAIRSDALRERAIEIDTLQRGFHVLDQATGRHKTLRDLRGTDVTNTLAPWERNHIRRHSF